MKAHELIDRPEKWTQLAEARDQEGVPVRAFDRNPVSWCAIGAINKAYRGCSPFICKVPWYVQSVWKWRRVCDRLREAIGQDVSDWNDHSDWQTVHAKLVELDI
jgi:hypothetical protein